MQIIDLELCQLKMKENYEKWEGRGQNGVFLLREDL